VDALLIGTPINDIGELQEVANGHHIHQASSGGDIRHMRVAMAIKEWIFIIVQMPHGHDPSKHCVQLVVESIRYCIVHHKSMDDSKGCS